MRIISGIYGSRSINAPDGRDTRPTMDKVKGAMFNIIGSLIEGSIVLDLFSGSGSLGIEALSRGAKKVYFNDYARKPYLTILDNLNNLKVEKDKYQLTSLDYKTYLNKNNAVYDVIFLDPPYKNKIYEEIILKLKETNSLSSHCCIICEADLKLELLEIEGFTVKEHIYGNKKLIVFKN